MFLPACSVSCPPRFRTRAIRRPSSPRRPIIVTCSCFSGSPVCFVRHGFQSGGEVRVALLRPYMGPAPAVRVLPQVDGFRDPSVVLLVDPEPRRRVDSRSVVVVSEPVDPGCAGRPVLYETARGFELQVLGARAAELVRHVARPGEQLLVDFAAPVEAVLVGGCSGTGVDEPVRRLPGPLAAVRVFVGLELDLEERHPGRAHSPSALVHEAVRFGMFRGGVVEDDDIAPAGVELSRFQQCEQEHSARSPAGELDDVRELGVAGVAVVDFHCRALRVEASLGPVVRRISAGKHPLAVLRDPRWQGDAPRAAL